MGERCVQNESFIRLLLFFAAGTFIASAQTSVLARRADGQMTPLQVYEPISQSKVCAPLAIISHGAGGSERQLRYLASALSADGYTAIVMGHRESGLPVLLADIRERGQTKGIVALLTDKNVEAARLLDVGAALAWAEGQCHAPFRVLLGHSMGAETTMLEAGAKNVIGIASPPAAQDRFDAYIPLSPEGPGTVFADLSWDAIRKPLLEITGTRDQSLHGGPTARLIPYAELPPDGERHCHWLGVISGATHADIGGNGIDIATVEPQVLDMIRRFLDGVRAGRCSAPPSTATFKVVWK